jgi:hypothetical protein
MQLRTIIGSAASCATIKENIKSIRLPSILDERDLLGIMLIGSDER